MFNVDNTIFAIAWVLNGGEHLETFGEATGIADFVWIFGHSWNLDIPDKVHGTVRDRYAAISLM